MKFGNIRTLLLFAAVCVLVPLSPAHAQKDLKLKEGAAGTVCLSCHEGMKEVMDKPFVHSPLADGDCVGCHNPHTSNFEMLMAAPAESICYTCHDSVVPDGAKSVHKVVADGQCTLCHDPHASENEFNLLKKDSELCSKCHQELAGRIKEAKYSHPPVRENCLECHAAHAAGGNEKLLDAASPELCLQCHETDKETFKKLHMNYPVETADCTSCHDPHGSNTAAMLFDNVHDPVAKRSCEHCHVSPTDAQPFALKAPGYETCMACHYEMITDALNQNNLHWPLADRKGCINCHSPHASTQKKLISEPMLEMCGKCHGDTVARQARSATPHPPIAQGECGKCHSPHGSDYPFLQTKETLIELCADCHEWQTHTTHPIGEDFVDPRNKNVTVQCASCHRTHGTEYKHFLYFSTANELCVQCHVRFRR